MNDMHTEAVNIQQHRRRKSRALALEIARVLRGMGGAAHLTALVGVLSAQRRGRAAPIPENLAHLVQSALLEFDHMAKHDQDRLFHRPFGVQSSRWALWPAAARIDDEVDTLLEETGLPKDAPEAIEAARRGVLRILESGERGSHVDVTVLDELERRGRLARLKTRH